MPTKREVQYLKKKNCNIMPLFGPIEYLSPIYKNNKPLVIEETCGISFPVTSTLLD